MQRIPNSLLRKTIEMENQGPDSPSAAIFSTPNSRKMTKFNKKNSRSKTKKIQTLSRPEMGCRHLYPYSVQTENGFSITVGQTHRYISSENSVHTRVEGGPVQSIGEDDRRGTLRKKMVTKYQAILRVPEEGIGIFINRSALNLFDDVREQIDLLKKLCALSKPFVDSTDETLLSKILKFIDDVEHEIVLD
ncbi:hypothetical protein MRB53_029141 [Persea americana]|uniref:Uncharacterized protein n=1 Tax=Persea americana TaxID=3435 RepID=A0ACC2KHX7_PERAE|nr:hypothetical protein MRB53_029141 [Persea americana]